MGLTISPVKHEKVISQSPTFFLDAIRYLPFITSAALNLFVRGLPVPEPEVLWRSMSRKWTGLDEEKYLLECVENRIIPFSNTEIGYNERNDEFTLDGRIALDRNYGTYSPFLSTVVSGGKPHYLQLGLSGFRNGRGLFKVGDRNDFEKLYHSLLSFLFKTNYQIQDGYLRFDETYATPFSREDPIAYLRTNETGKEIDFYPALEEGHLNSEQRGKLHDWFSKINEIK